VLKKNLHEKFLWGEKLRTTLEKNFWKPRDFLPRKNAKNTKRSSCPSVLSALSAFFCGYHLWLRRQPGRVPSTSRAGDPHSCRSYGAAGCVAAPIAINMALRTELCVAGLSKAHRRKRRKRRGF